jgi:RNA polymerase sigma-70 factor (ECF subfamily)
MDLAPAARRAADPAANLLAQWLAAADREAAAAPARAAEVGALLLGHQDHVRRLVHRLLGWPGDGAAVDDVVQEVLLAAWRHRASFRGEARVTTWLVRIALRKVQNHVRWRRVRRRLLRPFDGSHDPVAAPGACPVEAADEVRAVHAAMAALPHGDREVLVLRYLEDRPIEEIAALLGCARNAAEQRLSRARARLRGVLAGGAP